MKQCIFFFALLFIFALGCESTSIELADDDDQNETDGDFDWFGNGENETLTDAPNEEADTNEATENPAQPDGDEEQTEQDDPPETDGDIDEFDFDQPPTVYPIETAEVEWEACSLYEGENDGLAECSFSQFPLFWEDETREETITVAAKRLLASGESKTQLWLLHGGPGASGVHDFPRLMERLQSLYPEMDVYTIDHRGVGYSDRLGCPEQEAPDSEYGSQFTYEELRECIEHLGQEYGDKLNGYTTTYSAVDLAAYIHATKEEGKDVVVWGGSYGTFIGQRYLQIFPEQAAGSVLEGNCPPDFTFIDSQEYYDKAGRLLLDVCKEDDYCDRKLDHDPEDVLENLLNRLNQGHCGDLGLDGDYWRYMLGNLIYYHPYHLLVPAMIYRLDRCNTDDMWAIYHLYETIFGDDGSLFDHDNSFSSVLYYHIRNSELWHHPNWQSDEEMLEYWREINEEALFGSSSGAGSLELMRMWPVYHDPEHDDRWPQTNIPLLILQGKLDPATPWEKALSMKSHYTADLQHFVVFDYSPHNVHSGSPYGQLPASIYAADQCGEKVFVDFLKNPNIEPDFSCLDELIPVVFKGTEDLNFYATGTVDIWEGDYVNYRDGRLPKRPQWMKEIAKEIQRKRLASPHLMKKHEQVRQAMRRFKRKYSEK